MVSTVIDDGVGHGSGAPSRNRSFPKAQYRLYLIFSYIYNMDVRRCFPRQPRPVHAGPPALTGSPAIGTDAQSPPKADLRNCEKMFDELVLDFDEVFVEPVLDFFVVFEVECACVLA